MMSHASASLSTATLDVRGSALTAYAAAVATSQRREHVDGVEEVDCNEHDAEERLFEVRNTGGES